MATCNVLGRSFKVAHDALNGATRASDTTGLRQLLSEELAFKPPDASRAGAMEAITDIMNEVQVRQSGEDIRNKLLHKAKNG
ncbi:hypothetical protein IFU40_13130 [Microbacterium sp. CFBP 13617]|uniref:hypothetical protein n=1 Tax=Microbacterium sp. CFBP 13617 TaxID=2774035 RepID=UPI001780C96B|nr:hypothetical protein [Microbacterium sp. CFBP 13617]MBD8219577.1 hypothetical protein [Microbacterium sp. CFBP 13617]